MAAKSGLKKAYNPLILRCLRLMEAFAKSDEERDFYLDRQEGFIVFADLNKEESALLSLEKELKSHEERYYLIPKMSFYETKKIMENFVNEKVYDIDVKEKLLDIIQGKDARETFLEFLYDHEMELEKWQQFYQERARIRIIEWLRNHHFDFVFEEDLDLSINAVEMLKQSLFQPKVSTELQRARKALEAKAKIYYKDEALNPRPKRGRPPKQSNKVEVELQVTNDIYTTVPSPIRPFLFTPDITAITAATFSARYDSEEELLASLRNQGRNAADATLASLNDKLAALRDLSHQWLGDDQPATGTAPTAVKAPPAPTRSKARSTAPAKKTTTATKAKVAPKKAPVKKATPTKKAAPAKKTTAKRTLKRTGTAAKSAPSKAPAKKKAEPAAKKKKPLARLRTTRTKKK